MEEEMIRKIERLEREISELKRATKRRKLSSSAGSEKRWKKYLPLPLAVLAALAAVGLAMAAEVPHTFGTGGVISATKFNENFTYIVDRLWDLNGSNLYYTGGNVGIGTTNPTGKLEVVGDGPTWFYHTVAGSDATSDIPGHAMIRARGTLGAMDAVQAADTLGWLGATGRYDSGWPAATNVGIGFFAAEDFTNIANGTSIAFFTTEIGATSKSQRMIITNDGDVGIGATNPSALMHLDTSSGDYGLGMLRLENESDANRVTINLKRPSKSWYIHHTGSSDTTSDAFSIADEAAHRLVVDNSGNVGIGTTSSGAKLDVNGALKSNSLSGDWDNSSSGYVRLGNVQICWGSFGAIGHTSTSAALYTGMGTLTTFPVAFKGGTVPTVAFMPDYANDGLYSISVEVGNNNTGFTPRVWASVSGTKGGSNQYMAVGVWQ